MSARANELGDLALRLLEPARRHCSARCFWLAAIVLSTSCGHQDGSKPSKSGAAAAKPPPVTAKKASQVAPALSPPSPSPCPASPGEVFFKVVDPRLPELSGLVESAARPGLLWTHNDSGDEARVFAVAAEGVAAVVTLKDVQAVDFEDIAWARGVSNTELLVVADTGDNFAQRPAVDLYRFAAPKLNPSQREVTVSVARQRLRYKEGPTDVEAVLVDPWSSDVVLIGKGQKGKNELYVLPSPAFDGQLITVESLGAIELGLVTAADISRDGRLIAVRTYTAAFLFERNSGQSVVSALLSTPCKLAVADEAQGEAIAIDAVGSSYFTVSEGLGQPLHRYRFH